MQSKHTHKKTKQYIYIEACLKIFTFKLFCLQIIQKMILFFVIQQFYLILFLLTEKTIHIK